MATQTLPIPDRKPPQGKVTFEEFLAWGDEDTWAEWVDGRIIVMSPASSRHQDLVRFLLTLLNHHIEEHSLGWLCCAPFLMYLSKRPQGREPDLLFVRKDRKHLIEENHLNGPADLVVEIVSPYSIARDRGEKFVEYEAGGVFEYWLIDPQRRQAEFYQLSEEGQFQLAPCGPDGFYTSQAVSGFRLQPGWLWQDPLPKVSDAAREIRA